MLDRTKDGIRLAVLLHDVSRLRRVVVDRALKALGTTWAQWLVLARLSRQDGLSQTALAAGLELSKVAVGDVLSRMEIAGLVERRGDGANARIRRVHLTCAGRRMLEISYTSIKHFPAVMMHPVSHEDLAVTLRVLEQIKNILVEFIHENGAGPYGNLGEDIQDCPVRGDLVPTLIAAFGDGQMPVYE